MTQNIIIGSRKSELALKQTYLVRDLLLECYPSLNIVIKTFTTTGDYILDVPLSSINDKALFTKELDLALINKEIDFVVHSLKDIPTTIPASLQISAFIKRELPNDVLVMKLGSMHKHLHELPDGSVIGTSSVRRTAQLKRAYKNLIFKSVRGNLNTRLRKLDENNEYSALILAFAGMKRLGLENRISNHLSIDECMPAVGQGAIAVMSRKLDNTVTNLLKDINHKQTEYICTIEREMMKKLEGGCSVPIGIYCEEIEDQQYKIYASITELNGDEQVRDKMEIKIHTYSNTEEAKDVGIKLADSISAKGGRIILEGIRKNETNKKSFQ